MTQRSIRDSAASDAEDPAEPAEWDELAAEAEPGQQWPPPLPPREPQPSLKQRLRRTSPGVALLAMAAVLSLGFLLFEISIRTASVPVLTSAGLVCGMVYLAITIACGAATWRLGHEGRLGPALLTAFLGGCASCVAAGSFAGALWLFMTLGF